MNKVLDAYSMLECFRCLVLHHWHRSRQRYLPAGAVWCFERCRDGLNSMTGDLCDHQRIDGYEHDVREVTAGRCVAQQAA